MRERRDMIRDRIAGLKVCVQRTPHPTKKEIEIITLCRGGGHLLSFSCCVRGMTCSLSGHRKKRRRSWASHHSSPGLARESSPRRRVACGLFFFLFFFRGVVSASRSSPPHSRSRGQVQARHASNTESFVLGRDKTSLGFACPVPFVPFSLSGRGTPTN